MKSIYRLSIKNYCRLGLNPKFIVIISNKRRSNTINTANTVINPVLIIYRESKIITIYIILIIIYPTESSRVITIYIILTFIYPTESSKLFVILSIEFTSLYIFYYLARVSFVFNSILFKRATIRVIISRILTYIISRKRYSTASIYYSITLNKLFSY